MTTVLATTVMAQPNVPNQGVNESETGTGIENGTEAGNNPVANAQKGIEKAANQTGAVKNARRGLRRARKARRMAKKIQQGNFSGKFTTPSGKKVHIKSRQRGRARIKAGNAVAKTKLNLSAQRENNRTRIQARLSNGRKANVKVMPDQASQRALQALRMNACSEENNCSIKLKEVGQGNQTNVAYQARAKKRARVLGIFSTEMSVESEVDAKSGEVIRSRKPWWAFLASE